MMTSAQIRQSFLDFFKSKQHTIVPSSSLMPDAPNLLFTNAGMNQFVPIFLGQTKCPYAPGRAADTQKCIRAGGKHNDLDDVGLDTYHHTFFEMLGNWSFGDYFKKEAIEWAWELVVGVWEFPPERLYATVFCPHMDVERWKEELSGQVENARKALNGWDVNLGTVSQTPSGAAAAIFSPEKGTDAGTSVFNFSDRWAAFEWAKHFLKAGLDPLVHIIPGDKKDNFWMMGETGPCGPCSELHVDLTPAGDTRGSLVNKGDARCIEIWNLVFIQFNANPDGTFSALPARHVDTGMGFERVTSFIQCTKGFTDFTGAISNYETDIFRPIFDALEKLSGKKYGSTLPQAAGSATVPVAPVGVSPAGSGELGARASSPESVGGSPTGAASAQDAAYHKRRLPHFERPWAKYMASFSTRERRRLSPAAKDIVLKSLLFGHEQRRYQLYAATVLPDHVHFLFEPQIKEEDKQGKPVFWSLPEILQAIKSFTAHEINRSEGTTGQVWENESFDRMIRGDADLEEKFHYICRNPWDSGVVPIAENYPWLWTPDVVPEVSSTVPMASSRAVSGKSRQRDADDSGRDARAPQTEQQIAIDVAFRVIADHIRTLSFAIADGIQPSNEGRGYVLRRILRRAVRYGRTLGFHEPFFYKLVDVLADTMGDVFPEIRAKKDHVEEFIQREEEAFNKTLDNGIAIFETSIHPIETTQTENIGEGRISIVRSTHLIRDKFLVKEISGSLAFQLYDTYGFPLDLTELMARERGLTVDKERFEKLMEQQRARARAAQKKDVIELSGEYPATRFVGYETLEADCRLLEFIKQIRKDGGADSFAVVDVCPLYAEMGGQVGDAGKLRVQDKSAPIKVIDTVKRGSVYYLKLDPTDFAPVQYTQGGAWVSADGEPAYLSVDAPRRIAIQRHHTVTHLFHWALHEVVSKEASQKGSFVGPDKLTFDFNSAPLTPQQIADIEKLVNERILENAPVSWKNDVPYAEVKGRKDILQFFGDKYGDTVRVVQIGGRAGELDGYSMELCGGTHTRATGEIGLFRIVGESAIAAGVRRIEAVAGLQAYELANQQLRLLRSVAGHVNSPIQEVEKKIEALLAHQKELEKQVKIAMQRNASNAASELLGRAQTVNGVPLITHNLGDADGDFLQAIADALKGRFKGVVVLGGCSNNAVTLVATVSSDFTAKVQAGKIIQQIAPIVGGKGGGKPDNARGGGKDASKLDEALAKAKSLL